MELTALTIPTGQLTLSGPSEQLDAAHLPLRGDLAHVRLAGRCFVPHYAVPMARVVIKDNSLLRSIARTDAEELAMLASGTVFNVLDIAGNWAWGQVGDDGLVGYLPLETLGEA
ncbi:hypothetical protein MB02_00565 [Croceicoccus estronivorus]|uniref:SH3 domain-containing protein n=1 Tax=Croceicoccus estronivorus TaxID=1172626 RepID=UPI00082B4103|nr:SH3 domain-containing protein [Croceicoccus estronivorus]OCC25216.1 hypothetical protein MB02_00565 [Croceicoccus estronivorus]